MQIYANARDEANASAQHLNKMQMRSSAESKSNQMQIMHLNQMQMHLHQMQTVFYNCFSCVQQVLLFKSIYYYYSGLLSIQK